MLQYIIIAEVKDFVFIIIQSLLSLETTFCKQNF